MNCQDVRKGLELYVLGDQEAAQEEIRQHIAACSACAAEEAALKRALAAFKDAVKARSIDKAAITALRMRISALASGTAVSRMPTASHLTRTILPWAAAVALGIGIWYLLAHRSHHLELSESTHPQWTLANVVVCPDAEVPYPLVLADRVHVLQASSSGSHLLTLDRRTGKPLWVSSYPVAGWPIGDSNHVHVWERIGRDEWRLHTVESATGREAWSIALRFPATPDATPEMFPSGNVLCVTTTNGIMGYASASGQELWTVPLRGGGEGAWRLTNNGSLILAASRKMLLAVSARDGRLLWQQALDAVPGAFGAPRLAADQRYAVIAISSAMGPGRIECRNLTDGNKLWDRAARRPMHVLMRDGIVYVRGPLVEALRAQNGTLLWSAQLEGCSPVAIYRHKLYLVENRRGVLALEPRTGNPLWRSAPIASCSGIVIADRIGYVSSADGRLRALRIGI